MGDLEQVAMFLAEARRRFAAVESIEDARRLRTTIAGLEKHFTGGIITLDETEAFMAVFFAPASRERAP